MNRKRRSSELLFLPIFKPGCDRIQEPALNECHLLSQGTVVLIAMVFIALFCTDTIAI
jgi:hypothetical protein